MPDHVHILFEPGVKADDPDGKPIFWSLSELLHSLKSFTAHKIQDLEGGAGIWEKESHDRMIRSEADLQEKFEYVTRNPWDAGLADPAHEYEWTWVPESDIQRRAGSRRDAESGTRDARATHSAAAPRVISGAFAFRLYDEQGFPLDLTELMARERGLTVDIAGFEVLMEEQRARARAAQKKQVIELSEIETKTPTHFLGYDHNHTGADVAEVLNVKGKTAVILNNSVCYAEMGGQVGDTGELSGSGRLWRIANTQKSGQTFLHFLDEPDGPAVGDHVTIQYDAARRAAIQRHHSVTHLLHWALHEVVSREATQKGSFVGPDKLTFDFNSAALTPAQVRDIERLVNERIVENAAVSWIEMPYAEVRGRADIMQFFGDKYGETVRVVQIGGKPQALDGYSMELCAGTHTRHTGEIGLFRIGAESAIAAGVRRIEATAGLHAYADALADSERLKQLAGRLGAPLGELEKKLESMLAQQKELERQLESLRKKQAAATAAALAHQAVLYSDTPAIVEALEGASGDELQSIADALKASAFHGVVFLAGVHEGQAALLASVSQDLTGKFQAGKLIQAVAPMLGGKGGGRPDNARGAGKDTAKVAEALGMVRALLSGE
jgi:alanyl-tRNA synthetase